MKRYSTYQIVITALFAALICVATMLIRIPIPATGGYANLGDGVILICAFLMHPLNAVIAAGLGSMLADVLAGYLTYAPGTLVIKAAVALVALLIHDRLKQKLKQPVPAMVLAGVLAEILMVLGYFVYEALFLGLGLGAAGAIVGNIGQGAVGVLVSCLAAPALGRSREIRELLKRK